LDLLAEGMLIASGTQITGFVWADREEPLTHDQKLTSASPE
jgi:hypothetical protein